MIADDTNGYTGALLGAFKKGRTARDNGCGYYEHPYRNPRHKSRRPFIRAWQLGWQQRSIEIGNGSQ